MSTPTWTAGPLNELIDHVRAHSSNVAERRQTLAELETAESQWRRSPDVFAEHYGFLADAYYMLFVDSGAFDALAKARQYHETVARCRDVSGLVRARLYLLGFQLDMAEAGREGGPDAMARVLSDRCAALRADLKRHPAPTLLSDLARNTQRWGKLAAEASRWGAAADAFELGARALDELFRRVSVEERGRVLYAFPGLDAAAVSALARAERFRDALVTLEVSRQRLTRFLRGISDLERILATEDPQLLQTLMEDQAAWRDAAQRSLDGVGEHDVDQAQTEAAAAEERLVETLARVRRYSGLERYALRPDYADVSAAADAGPLLFVSTSDYDTVLIFVLPGGSIRYTRVDLGTVDLASIVRDWLSILDPRAKAPTYQRQQTLERVAAILERYLTPAIQETLTHPFQHGDEDSWRWGSVTLVVSGLLSFLPAHAWTPSLSDRRERLLRYMPLSYAPSARQATLVTRSPRPTGASRSLLSVADPEPRPANLRPLPCARLESSAIAESARSRSLLHGPDADKETVERLIPDHEVLHFACHAEAAPGRAAEAHLELAHGDLSGREVLDRFALDHVALVVLSACRSGQPDLHLPDEALDLGSVFLAAGARAVVSNMWPVDDLAAALFVRRLFEAWDWGEGLPLPAATHHAATWLRELRVGELRAMAAGMPGWRLPIYRRTRGLADDFERFARPYFWAAFKVTGR